MEHRGLMLGYIKKCCEILKVELAINNIRSEESVQLVLDMLRDLFPGLCTFQFRPPGTLREQNTILMAR